MTARQMTALCYGDLVHALLSAGRGAAGGAR
jgi:hypothetical protein